MKILSDMEEKLKLNTSNSPTNDYLNIKKNNNTTTNTHTANNHFLNYFMH